MVFGEVKVREPERRCRPDRDRRFACIAYEVPGPLDLPIFLDRQSADAIERHALRDTSVELGGILLGKECLDEETGEPFVWVTKSLEAKHYENTQASFTYTHDSWEEITRERDRLYPELDIVGWYHTHPDFGIFLSSHDLFIHRNFFAQPLQVAYVVDPIRQTRGFFQWREGRVDALGGFFLSADRSERIALSRLVNDLEGIPNTDGGGSGLSPRLEAELIAMLTRPAQQHVPMNAYGIQAAALFGVFGAMLGVLAVAAVLWLNSFYKQMQEQTLALQEITKGVNQNSAANQLILNTKLADIKDGPDRFLDQYKKVVSEREVAEKTLAEQRYVNELLARDAKGMTTEMKKLETDVKALRKKAEDNEQDAKDVASYRKRVGNLESENETQAAKIQQLSVALDSTEGRRALELLEKYNRTWWVAAAGWVVSLLLVLGLIVTFANTKEPVSAEPPPVENPEGPAPIRIT